MYIRPQNEHFSQYFFGEILVCVCGVGGGGMFVNMTTWTQKSTEKQNCWDVQAQIFRDFVKLDGTPLQILLTEG